jgi:hypothetical protein
MMLLCTIAKVDLGAVAQLYSGVYDAFQEVHGVVYKVSNACTLQMMAGAAATSQSARKRYLGSQSLTAVSLVTRYSSVRTKPFQLRLLYAIVSSASTASWVVVHGPVTSWCALRLTVRAAAPPASSTRPLHTAIKHTSHIHPL